MRHAYAMVGEPGPIAIHRTLIESLTVDAMVLADEIESYFGGDELEVTMPGMDSARQAIVARVGLRLATRITRLVEWLVRADARTDAVPEAVGTADSLCADDDLEALPPRARALAEATRDLLARIERLRDLGGAVPEAPSPARALQARLAVELAGEQG